MLAVVVFYNQKEGTTPPNKKEIQTMTKKQMIDYIESANFVVDFDRKYLMRKSKDYLQGLYDAAVVYVARKAGV